MLGQLNLWSVISLKLLLVVLMKERKKYNLYCGNVAKFLFTKFIASIYRAIGLMSRVFAKEPGDRGSIPGRVIQKTQKMVLNASLLNTQHYEVIYCIKSNSLNADKL